MINDAALTQWLKRALAVATPATPYVAVGTSTQAESASDTALVSETVRVLASVVSVASNVATIKAFFNTGQANVTIGEVGLQDQAAGGVNLDRSVLSPTQVKDATKEMIVEYAITLSRA